MRLRLYEREVVLKGWVRTIRLEWSEIASFIKREYTSRFITRMFVFFEPGDTYWLITRKGPQYPLGGFSRQHPEWMLHELNLAVDEARINGGKVDLRRFNARVWDKMVEPPLELGPRPRAR